MLRWIYRRVGLQRETSSLGDFLKKNYSSVQVQIFLRGAQLTKVGGRIVYSTCSFNPVENEAVVAEVLRRANGKPWYIRMYMYINRKLIISLQGALILKDVSDQLPELKRKPGLTSWKVNNLFQGGDDSFVPTQYLIHAMYR